MATTTYGTPYVQSSDLVSAYPGTSSTLATRVDDISLKGNGLNDQTGTTYTLVLTDGGKTITLNNASAVTVTIPTNTSVAFPLGTEINFVNKGAGTVTIQPTGGVTLNGGNLTLPQFAAVQVVKLETNTWGQLDSVATAPGLTLISPSSIANSGGSASASGGAVTFTTVNSVSLNGVFTSTFENYKVVLTATGTVSGTTRMRLRFRVGGTDNTNASYTYGGRSNALSGSTDLATTDQTSAIIGDVGDTRAGIVFDVTTPFSTLRTNYMSLSSAWGTSSGGSMFVTGVHFTDTSFDGLTIYPTTGTITGGVRVYGYRN